ncbi:SMC5-SMC6 complex localization factor protein 1 [Neosynchiropus ocellatus]
MDGCTHVIQISGIKDRDTKKVLVRGILKLGGKYIGGSVYQNGITHLIIPQVLSSEKFLASCAAGKWVVTPEYVLDSVKSGSWLPEECYEISLCQDGSSDFYPTRKWREKVADGVIRGAFQDWRVLLVVQDPNRCSMFKRLLNAGCAEVYDSSLPPSPVSITHVLAKPELKDSGFHVGPCYPVSYIVQYLFGSKCLDMSIYDDGKVEGNFIDDDDYSDVETVLKDFAIKQEGRPRLCFLEFLGYRDPYRSKSQITDVDLRNIGIMIECGLFKEALDSIRSEMFSGFWPPAPYMVSLLGFAQQGKATPEFLNNFNHVMHRLLISNPPWIAPNTRKKYFTKVLQCPQCKTGLWPFLESVISYCVSGVFTCHQLPEPTAPTLFDFHFDMLGFILKLFQAEFHAVFTGDFLPLEDSGDCNIPASSTLLYGTFWTVWERSTLLSREMKRLIQLVTQAATEDIAESGKKQKKHVVHTLLDLQSVLVEFWCQQHFKLNPNLVAKGLKDLAEFFARSSQDLSDTIQAELVVQVPSSRLKLALGDAIFQNMCRRDGFTVGDDALSLKKVVTSYLPALGRLAQSPSGAHHRMRHTSHSCTSLDPSCGGLAVMRGSTPWKGHIPKGLNKVNVAGETLLHRACKRNQVETVLQILALPGTDVNIKDHVGWSPLHEACNHGSTECVEALLRHRPIPVINSLVDGVSPLHDALLNGHMDIAKMLLETAGSCLLQPTGSRGITPLDLVSSTDQRSQLLHSAQIGDSNLTGNTVSNKTLLEAGSALLMQIILNYLQETGLLTHLRSPGSRLIRALGRLSPQDTALQWTDPQAVRLLEDARTMLEVGRGKYLDQVAQAVKDFRGEHTVFLLELLENLKSEVESLQDGR